PPRRSPDLRHGRRLAQRHPVFWLVQATSPHSSRSISSMIYSCSKPVGRAKSAPVPAIDADRHVDLAHHDGLAVAHVAGVALDQIGAQIATGGEARGVVEDAAVAAV